MAMHEDFLIHLVESRNILAYHKNHFFFWAGQILPIPVERRDAMGLELLWIVAETDLIADSVSAERVFTRLLQVYDNADLQLEHLRDHLVLLNQARAGPLRTDKFTLDKV